MILSGKYNEAMDKIKLSDELKREIKKEAAERLRKKKKKSPVSYISYAAAAAACIAICFAAVKFIAPSEVAPNPPVLIGNPFEDFSGIDELAEKTPFALKTPEYLPEGYAFSSAALILGETAQINYSSDNDELCYRCAESDSDVSVDYNTYEATETVKTESGTVTLRKNGGSVHLATWQSGKMAYSLSSADGLSDEEFIKIIESVK